ncbi:hypothetical protein STSP_35060 [Streptomyces jeddahensis]|uniref:Uncharacterized protein n=2 Tax=Streptomyces jeddahensis TaxID=1716141 RepID=A0A177HQB2_9ACTN|nr:hypothetical protein STSP_35060 [Streptomyces jeddahensis]
MNAPETEKRTQTDGKQNGKRSRMPSTDSTESTESTETAGPKESKGPDRRALAVAAVLLAACGGLVLYGVLDTGEKKPEQDVPRASVTYEVTGDGTADITYQGRSRSGEAAEATGVELPWRKTVDVPLGRTPTVTITLGEKGGRASCALAVRGKHVQTATAYGEFGRATCRGELPPAAESSTSK